MKVEPTKFHRILQSHTVAILDRSKTPPGNGTGTFIKYLDKHFVITAYHVIKGLLGRDLLITLGLENQRSPLTTEKIGIIEHLDLAYIQLNDTEAEYCRGLNIEPFKIVTREENKDIKSFRHAVNGFPIRSFDEQENVLKVESFLITSFLVEPHRWPESIKPFLVNTDSLNKNNNFLLGYDVKNGRPINGMSGAGVWIFDPETENDDKPLYQLYGVQTQWYIKERLIRGSFVHPLIEKIKQDYK